MPSALFASSYQARSTVLPGRDEIRRILVLKWSAMGDVALASAAIEDIVRAFPLARIDLDTLPPWDRLYAHDPRFTEVRAFDLRARRGRLREALRWLRHTAQARYDLIVDLQTTDRSRSMIAALVLFGRPVPHRLGNKPAFPYNLAPAPGQTPRSALAIAQATLRAGGIPTHTDHPVLYPGVACTAAAQARMAAAGLQANDFAVFLPGCQAAGYLKRWGAPRYAALARLLLARGVGRIALLGGPDEMDECAAIAAASDPRVVNLCGQTALLEVPVICAAARFTVANDTGTGHLAAAAARPLVVICGVTDPRRVRPAGAQVRTVQLDLPCRNCYRKHCAHQSCMRLLPPSMLLEALADCL